MFVESDCEILMAVRGSLYRRIRDQLLASGPNLAVLENQSKNHTDQRFKIIATIVAHWVREREMFKACLHSLDGVNIQKEASNRTGVAGAVGELAASWRRSHAERILPLCWEQILKLGEGQAGWRNSAFLDTIITMPSEVSVEVLLWALEDAGESNYIDAIHQALIRLPYANFKERLLLNKRALQFRSFVMEDLLRRIELQSANDRSEP